MNYNFDMHGKWVPTNYFNETVRDYGYKYDNKYLDKWIKEEKNMSAKFTFRGVDYDVDIPEDVIISLRTISGDRIPDKIFTRKNISLSTRNEVDFEEMYVFFSKIVLHQLHHEGYRIVRDYDSSKEYHVSVARNSGRYPWGLATDYSGFSWKCNIPEIKNVIYNMPATIVEWSDGTKTISKCEEGEIFDREKGLMAAYMQKMESIKGRKLWKTLDKWLPKGLDLDKDPVNENMSMYVQSALSRDHEKNCKKLNKQLKEKTGKNLMEILANWLLNDIDIEKAKAEAVEQADIDDDQTKEPALEKKDQLNQEFDKLMNPPVNLKRGEHNTAAFLDQYKRNIVTGLVVSESLNDPDFNGYSDYPNGIYLLPGEATKWLRKYQHDIIVPFTNKRGTYYRYDELSYQKMGTIINDIYAHAQESVPGIHRGKYDVNWEKIFGVNPAYTPVMLTKDIHGKNNKSTGKLLINFEFLKLLVVR